MVLGCVKSQKSKVFRYNVSEVRALLHAFLNDGLPKNNDGYIQGCHAIRYDYTPSGLTLTTFIHQSEMHGVTAHLQGLKVARASRWIEGYHWYALMVWLNRENPHSEKNADMPQVRQHDIQKAIEKLMALYFKKVGDRLNGRS